MKKRIACPGCNGNGRITLARMYNDYCGIGCKQCDYCGGNGFLEVPMTNADRIRTMSDKELEWTIDPAIVPPGMTKREWLQQPAKEG